jgi:hypothetical protein
MEARLPRVSSREMHDMPVAVARRIFINDAANQQHRFFATSQDMPAAIAVQSCV